MKQKLILTLAVLVPLTLLAVHPLPQVTQTNVPVVVGGTNQLIWHDLRQTNRVWLAKPKKGRHLEALAAIAKFSKKQKHLSHVGLIRFETDERSPKSQIPTNLVEYVVPDRLVQIQDVIPNDPLWTNQWDMAKIQMPSAWGISTGSSNVIVAVIDTGIDFTHPDLQGNLWVNPTNGTHGYQCYGGVLEEGGADVYGHGTHCAGTIAAVGNNVIGMAGENWRVKVLSMAFLNEYGSGQDSDAILLIEKLIELKQSGQNIRVCSDSWGGFGNDQALTDAFQGLEESGVLSTCASGNSALNIDTSIFSPAGQTNRGIISVNASDNGDALAYFSDYGLANTDIAAPGVLTWSTIPMNTNLPLSAASGYKPLSGTSMATPHVAGVSALLFAVNPNLTVYEAKDIILNHSSYDPMSDNAGRLSSSGGRLNAYKTISNPLVFNPRTNQVPAFSFLSHPDVLGGQTGKVSFAATDADNDPLRNVTIDLSAGQVSFTSDFSFPTKNLYLDYSESFFAGAADGNGGAVGTNFSINAYSDSAKLVPQDYALDFNVDAHYNTNSYYRGEIFLVSVFATTNSQPSREILYGPFIGGSNYANWLGGGASISTHSNYFVPYMPSNGIFKVSVYSWNDQLSETKTWGEQIVRIGDEGNSTFNIFPRLDVHFDKRSGVVPFTLNFTITNRTDRVGTNQNFWIYVSEGNCNNCNWAETNGNYFNGSLIIGDVGIHNVAVFVRDTNHYFDLIEYKVSAIGYPNTNSPPPPPPPTNSLNQVTNLTATASSGQASLRWTDNSTGEDRYLVEASRKSKGSWVVWQTIEIPANLSSYAYRPAQSGFYRFRVRAAAGLTYAPWSLPSGQVKL